jgi:hypothetical protein
VQPFAALLLMFESIQRLLRNRSLSHV